MLPKNVGGFLFSYIYIFFILFLARMRMNNTVYLQVFEKLKDSFTRVFRLQNQGKSRNTMF